MGKAKKSTKKFMAQKSAGRQTFKKKPQWTRQKGQKEDGGPHTAEEEEKQQSLDGGKSIAEMDVDEFLSGDFLNMSDEGVDDASEDDIEEEEESGIESGDDDVELLEVQEEEDEDEEDDDDTNNNNSTDEVHVQNRRYKSEIAAHKAQLEKLKQSDPEFYEYLAATDKELLQFGGEDDDDEEEEEEEIEEEEEEEEDGQKEAKQGRAVAQQQQKGVVTLSLVDAWTSAALSTASLAATKALLRAYRVACHYGDSEDQVQETLRMGSSAAYNRLMLFVLKDIDGVFRRQLGIDKEIDGESLVKLPRWKKVEPMVKSYIGNTLHLLGQMTDASMLAFILRRLRQSIVFFTPYSKLQRRLLKAALTLFGTCPDHPPRIQAILLVRAMALKLPPPSLDSCLKSVYRAFSANAKFVNAASVPHINFMASCVVEMYGLDLTASYQHAFGFIRQLALLVRQALTSKSKESYREVYCWQTINCLEVWAKVLSAHADSDELRPLVYPVVQLLLGTARLVPTPSYFPLRLRCARALNRLAECTGVFVPVAPVLLEVLQWGDLAKRPKPAPGDKPVEVLLQLRAAKSVARSAQYQEEIVEQALELLADHLSQWACHVSFPELSHLSLLQLKAFAKTTGVEKFRRSARQLAEAIERNIAFVGRARDQVEFSPKDFGQINGFLAKEAAAKAAPVMLHAATLRERAKQRMLARSTRDVAVGRGKQQRPRGGGGGGEEDNELDLPRPGSGSGAGDVSSDEDEDTEKEIDVLKALTKKKKMSDGGGKDEETRGAKKDKTEIGGDQVVAYDLSSDEDDLDDEGDDERGRVPKRKSFDRQGGNKKQKKKSA